MPADPHDTQSDGPRSRRRAGASQSRIDELKRQVASGQYETEEKLETALRLMLDDLRKLATSRGASREGGSGGGSP